jgi:hypothetical protein
VDEMVDTHLINVALAGLGISAGIAVMIAFAIIGISAIVLHARTPRSGKLTLAHATVAEHRTPAAATAGHGRRAA